MSEAMTVSGGKASRIDGEDAGEHLAQFVVGLAVLVRAGFAPGLPIPCAAHHRALGKRRGNSGER